MGTGKTCKTVNLEYYCRPGLLKAYVVSVDLLLYIHSVKLHCKLQLAKPHYLKRSTKVNKPQPKIEKNHKDST